MSALLTSWPFSESLRDFLAEVASTLACSSKGRLRFSARRVKASADLAMFASSAAVLTISCHRRVVESSRKVELFIKSRGVSGAEK